MNRTFTQGCADGGVGASRPQIFSNLQESWPKVSHAASELATVFSVTIFINNSWSVGQSAPLPQKVSRPTTAFTSTFIAQQSKGLLLPG